MSMFEVGKSYRIITLEGDEQCYANYTLESVELPLIKVSQAGRTKVINTSSLSFISAELDDPEAREAAQAAWLDTLSDDDKEI